MTDRKTIGCATVSIVNAFEDGFDGKPPRSDDPRYMSQYQAGQQEAASRQPTLSQLAANT